MATYLLSDAFPIVDAYLSGDGSEVLAWLADLSTLPPIHRSHFIPAWATVHNRLDSMMFLMLY